MHAPEPPVSLARTPTRVERLDALSAEHDADLYVKRDDETAGVAQGNKVRKLEYLLGDAREADADVVVTCGGLQSNHCRAVAVLARRLGFDVHLLLRGEEPRVPDGNLLLDRLVGADVTYLDDADLADGWDAALDAAADDHRAEGRTPSVVPLGGSTPRGVLGYVRAFEELADWQADAGTLDRVYVPVGSGGTLAGLVAGCVAAGGPTVVGVNVTDNRPASVRRRVRGLVRETLDLLGETPPSDDRIDDAFAVRSGYVGPGYGEPTAADLETIAAVGRREGLVLDPTYTAKAFRAFRAEVDAGDRALFVHTGGSYGLFPHREALADVC